MLFSMKSPSYLGMQTIEANGVDSNCESRVLPLCHLFCHVCRVSLDLFILFRFYIGPTLNGSGNVSKVNEQPHESKRTRMTWDSACTSCTAFTSSSALSASPAETGAPRLSENQQKTSALVDKQLKTQELLHLLVPSRQWDSEIIVVGSLISKLPEFSRIIPWLETCVLNLPDFPCQLDLETVTTATLNGTLNWNELNLLNLLDSLEPSLYLEPAATLCRAILVWKSKLKPVGISQQHPFKNLLETLVCKPSEFDTLKATLNSN